VDQVRREIRGFLNDLKIPYAEDLESCARMVKRVWDYSRWLRTRKDLPTEGWTRCKPTSRFAFS